MDEVSNQFQKAVSGLLMLTMMHGLSTTLLQLAKFHDNQPGQWLDEIEAEVIDNLKGSRAEGIDMDIEASALKGALAYVESFFATFRNGLRTEKND